MIRIYWYTYRFECAFGVVVNDSIILYDENYIETNRIVNLTYRDWPHISIEGGTWTDPSEIPTETDRLQANIDYLDMQAESLQASDEANRADIDYCLMMLDDGATDEQLDDTTATDNTTTEETTEPLTDGDTTDEQLS